MDLLESTEYINTLLRRRRRHEVELKPWNYWHANEKYFLIVTHSLIANKFHSPKEIAGNHEDPAFDRLL